MIRLGNVRIPSFSVGVLFNPHAQWIGAHYSPYNKRLCINLLPMLTVYFVGEGGKLP